MAANLGPQYGHVPSQKSVDLGRNVFIFSNLKGNPARDVTGESERLLIGLNQDVTHATGATLLRWLQLLDRNVSSLELRRVRMEKSESVPFAVSVEKGSESDPVELGAIIPPGDYALNGRMCNSSSLLSFAKMKARATGNDGPKRLPVGDAINLYNFPAELKTKVVERDQNVCFMTGHEANESMDLSWIFPPTWGYLVEGNRRPWDFDRERYLVENNIVSMDSDLIDDFHDNAFGIDVDDGYKIITFRPLSCPDKLQQTHLPLTSRADGYYNRFDFFLRLHFCWCLQANLLGGDSYLENRDKIDDAFDRLGVDFYGNEHKVRKEDPEWLTDMGKAILDTLVMRGDVTREEANTYGVWQPQT